MPSTVLYEAGEAVATLTLNRPERLNAITSELAADLREALARADAAPEVRVIRLRGAGRCFCAGYDIGWAAETMEQAENDGVWPGRRLRDHDALRGHLHGAVALA